MGWIDKLQNRWNLKNGWQVLIVLVVFACTGLSVMFMMKPIKAVVFENGESPLWFSITYWIFIFPFYYLILLGYGFIFGQFDFFWSFTKRTWNRMIGKK